MALGLDSPLSSGPIGSIPLEPVITSLTAVFVGDEVAGGSPFADSISSSSFVPTITSTYVSVFSSPVTLTDSFSCSAIIDGAPVAESITGYVFITPYVRSVSSWVGPGVESDSYAGGVGAVTSSSPVNPVVYWS